MVDDVERLEEFFSRFYQRELMDAAAAGKKAIAVDFGQLDKFDHVLADKLLDLPAEMLPLVADAIAAMDTPYGPLKLIPRFTNLPQEASIRIRSLRSEHIGKLMLIDGIVRRAGEVLPEISVAIFKCPACEKHIEVQQTEKNLKKPVFCDDNDCGFRGQFEMVDRKLFDSRWLSLEEPHEVATAEQPGSVHVYLRDDLTTPEMQRKCDAGSRLKVVGIIKELKKFTKGAMMTQLGMYIEANHVEPTEIEWDEVIINPEDEKRIKDMANDPQIYDKLVQSIAPSIWGLNMEKEAIAYQLFGGVMRTAADGTRLRGDIHLLLVGDPAVGKSVSANSRLFFRSDGACGRPTIGELVDGQLKKNSVHLDGGAEVSLNMGGIHVLALDERTHKVDWHPVTAFIRHKAPDCLYRITTRSGRQVTGTGDHSFLILNPHGEIVSVRGDVLKAGMSLPIPLGMHREETGEIDISRYIEQRTNARSLKTKIALDRPFGFFMGTFLAEGSLTKGTIFIDNKSAELKEAVTQWLREAGMETNIKKERLFACSRSFCRFLEEVCYSGVKVGSGKGSGARRKRVPDFAFFAPREFVKGLLCGLFSGDGYFTSSKPAPNLGNLKIGLTTTSRELAEGALELLTGAGIFTKLREKNYVYRGNNRVCWELLMTGPAVEKFIRDVGIIGKSPKSLRISEKDELDSVPCGELLYSAVKELGYSRRLVEDSEERRTFGAMMRTVRARNRIGRRRLERIFNQLLEEAERQKNPRATGLLAKLRVVLDGNLVWDVITKIEKVKPDGEYVYDLSVDGKETFVTNGVAVHNTQLLKLVSKVIPRGKYVSGKGVTGVGLTASVTKDEELGGWVLEAGAMVLCHKSLIAIDEFDKMNKDDQIAMHEAMSTQTISIAKATIIATLPAQTAVLAGANPKLQRFDVYRPLPEQIDIPETLLSRFDLKFVLRDVPNKETDTKIAEHIMKVRMAPEEVKPLIPTEMLKKYVAYARWNCRPELTPEAAERLKSYYLEMRGLWHDTTDSLAITARQQEGLVRLSEAAAKVRLSDKVMISDVERAIRLMEYSLKQLAFDRSTGKIDIDRVEGVGTSKRNAIRTVLDIIDALEKTIGKKIPVIEIITDAQEKGVSKHEVDEIVNNLKREGRLFEVQKDHVQKLW